MGKYSLDSIDDISHAIYSFENLRQKKKTTKVKPQNMCLIDSLSEKTMINILAFLYKFKKDFQKHIFNQQSMHNQRSARPSTFYQYLLTLSICKINRYYYWYRSSSIFWKLQQILSLPNQACRRRFHYWNLILIGEKQIINAMNHSFFYFQSCVNTSFDYNQERIDYGCHPKINQQIFQTLNSDEKRIVMQRWDTVKARIEQQQKILLKTQFYTFQRQSHLAKNQFAQMQLKKLTTQNMDDITCIDLNTLGTADQNKLLSNYSKQTLINMFAFLFKNKTNYIKNIGGDNFNFKCLYEYVWARIFKLYTQKLYKTSIIIEKAAQILSKSKKQCWHLIHQKIYFQTTNEFMNNIILKSICVQKCTNIQHKNKKIYFSSAKIFFKCKECCQLFKLHLKFNNIIDQDLTERQMTIVTKRVQKLMKFQLDPIKSEQPKIKQIKSCLKEEEFKQQYLMGISKKQQIQYSNQGKDVIVGKAKSGISKLKEVIKRYQKLKTKSKQSISLFQQLNIVIAKLANFYENKNEQEKENKRNQNMNQMDFSFGLENKQDSFQSLIYQLYE